jgi:hypothetical protein
MGRILTLNKLRNELTLFVSAPSGTIPDVAPEAVIPTKAGIQSVVADEPMVGIRCCVWIPAFAGMTAITGG